MHTADNEDRDVLSGLSGVSTGQVFPAILYLRKGMFNKDRKSMQEQFLFLK